jgi:hypothetical protein
MTRYDLVCVGFVSAFLPYTLFFGKTICSAEPGSLCAPIRLHSIRSVVLTSIAIIDAALWRSTSNMARLDRWTRPRSRRQIIVNVNDVLNHLDLERASSLPITIQSLFVPHGVCPKHPTPHSYPLVNKPLPPDLITSHLSRTTRISRSDPPSPLPTPVILTIALSSGHNSGIHPGRSTLTRAHAPTPIRIDETTFRRHQEKFGGLVL